MVREINKRDMQYAKENPAESECHGDHAEGDEHHCHDHKAIYKLREKFKDENEPEDLWNYKNLSKGSTDLNDIINRGQQLFFDCAPVCYTQLHERQS